MHESDIEHQDGTQAKHGCCKSAKVNQHDIVFREQPSRYDDDAVENEIGSSTTTKLSDDFDRMNDTWPNELGDEGNIGEAAVDEDADVYEEVNPDVSHVHLILEKLTRRGKA